mmetsp:Transcript_43166/g.101914  ORF Transcript_43166/g.101914 Transcript_43166/m.101914 type:complete len:257 (-) Transcript_43166:55-825(-)
MVMDTTSFTTQNIMGDFLCEPVQWVSDYSSHSFRNDGAWQQFESDVPPTQRAYTPQAHGGMLHMNNAAPVVLSVDEAVASLFGEHQHCHNISSDLNVKTVVEMDPFAADDGWEEPVEQICAKQAEQVRHVKHEKQVTTVMSVCEKRTSSEASSCAEQEYLGSQGSRSANGSPSEKREKEKKRLIAWTAEEHEKFVYALNRLRTEDTEAFDSKGKRTCGLGQGIAEVIALAVGTRTAAQVRSHAQKHFTRQRRAMGL